MFTNQYYQLLELLQKKEKGTLNMGQMLIRKKDAIMVELLDKGFSIQLKTWQLPTCNQGKYVFNTLTN